MGTIMFLVLSDPALLYSNKKMLLVQLSALYSQAPQNLLAQPLVSLDILCY